MDEKEVLIPDEIKEAQDKGIEIDSAEVEFSETGEKREGQETMAASGIKYKEDAVAKDDEELSDFEDYEIRDEASALEKEKHDKKNRKIRKSRIITITGVAICLIFVIISIVGRAVGKEGSVFHELSVQNIGKFFDIGAFFELNYPKIIESIVIIFFAWMISKIVELVISIITLKGKRSVTIGKLIISIVKYCAVIFSLFMILSAWGVQTPTLLASAGILGLAISLGAQNLIEDVLSGLFIIFEKQFEIGDIIQIDDFRGKVIEIGIRTTRFEDLAGDVKIINNSDIRSAINTTSNLSPAYVDAPIRYDADLEAVEQVILNNLGRIRKRIPKIKEGPYYFGVSSLDASSVTLRIYTKSLEQDKHQVKRDLNREIKLLFDEYGIGIPYNQVVVHSGEKDVEMDSQVRPRLSGTSQLVVPAKGKRFRTRMVDPRNGANVSAQPIIPDAPKTFRRIKDGFKKMPEKDPQKPLEVDENKHK